MGVGLIGTTSFAATARSSQTPKSGTPYGELTTADILIETLIRSDVQYVFGIVGDGSNSIIEALPKRQDEVRFIAVRHEEAAAFMASGYAKHTGKLGVCPRPGQVPCI
jgi:glyoxylate carboligase